MKEFLDRVLQLYHEYRTVINIALGAVIFLLFLLLRNKLAKAVTHVLEKLIKNNEDRRKALTQALYRPLSVFFFALGLFLAVYLNIRSAAIVKCFKIAVILLICWMLLNYLSGNLFKLLHADDSDKINLTAVRFISNICKVLVTALAIVMIVSELGYNINGLITGIGVGGLAVSLAAQDAVSNLISGFIIVLEKPFKVGDFVKLGDTVGTVEDVAMRSTKLRTLDDMLVTIPNSSITAAPIIKYSKISHRLIDLEYGLTYDTPNDVLTRCADEIKDFLTHDDEILPSPVRVEFERMDDSALVFNVFCYTTQADVHEYKRVLGRVNYRIKELVEQNGASFAFPSTSVYIEKK